LSGERVTIGFIDNDILLKLVAFRLFKDAIASLGLTQNDLRVLPTAKSVFLRKRSQREIYSDDIWEQAIALVESCQSIPSLSAVASAETLIEATQLEPFKDIHQGESSLILATRNTPGFVLMSGDKSCLKVLPQIPPNMYKRLCGNVVCLEQIILVMIDVLGFDEVCSRITPATQYDKTMKICFGYSEPFPEMEVRTALQSYLNDIHSAAPGLLLKLP
jgi:hypothetical protein